jgi:signal transduction histidine kinase
MRRLSVRARLTLGSSLLALVLLTVALVVTRFVVIGMLNDVDTSLARADLAPFRVDIAAGDDRPDAPASGVLVRISSPSGERVVDTLPHELGERLEDRPLSGRTQLRIESADVPYAVVGETVDTPEGTWTMWAARSAEGTAIAIRGLDVVLAGGGAVLVALFALASWLLARAALAPVERMRRAAAGLPAEGDAVLPVGHTRDELAQLAATLNDFLGRIRAATTRERQMVSDAAHELRTPLAALRTRLELARAAAASDPSLEVELAAAERDATRLGDLASNLLALARLEQGPPPESTVLSEVRDAIGDAVDRARLLAPGCDIDLAASTDDDARLAVSATGIGRVVDNLLSNAITATGGAGRIRVELDRVDDDIVLAVEDDGPGMPEEFLPRAFERFARADDARARTSGGAGLGLALVLGIARAAGGDASVRNLHPGLRVEVRLPVCENSHRGGAPFTPTA